MSELRALITTTLDVLALLAVATGVFFLVRPYLGFAALIPAGLTVQAVSILWAMLWGRRSRAEKGDSR